MCMSTQQKRRRRTSRYYNKKNSAQARRPRFIFKSLVENKNLENFEKSREEKALCGESTNKI